MDQKKEKSEIFIDLQGFVLRILTYWYIPAVILVFAVVYALYKGQTSEPKFIARSSILLAEEGSQQKNSFLQDLNQFSKEIVNENEAAILSSSVLMYEVVDSLQLHVSIFRNGKNLYGNQPIAIEIIEDTNRSLNCDFIPGKDDSFDLLNLKTNKTISGEYGKRISIDEYELIFRRKKDNWIEPLQISISNKESVSHNFSRSVKAIVGSKLSNVVDLSFQGDDGRLAVDVVNSLMIEYIKLTKREEMIKTERAMDVSSLRIRNLQSSLQQIEDEIERFQREYKVTDLTYEGRNILDEISRYEQQISNTQSNLNYLDYIIQNVSKHEPESLLGPSTAGISDQVLIGLVEEYNNLLYRKMIMTQSAGELNPELGILRDQLEKVLSTILEYVEGLKQNTIEDQSSLQQQLETYSQRMNQLPQIERKYLSLQRSYDLQSDMYIKFLRTNSELKLASDGDLNRAKILDYAISASRSNASTKVLLMYWLAIGGVASLIILGIIDFIDPRLNSRDRLDHQINVQTLLHGTMPSKKASLNSNISGHLILNLRKKLGERNNGAVIQVSNIHTDHGSNVSQILASKFTSLGYRSAIFGTDLPGSDASVAELKERYKEVIKTVGSSPLQIELGSSLDLESIFRELKSLIIQMREDFDYVIILKKSSNDSFVEYAFSEIADFTIFCIEKNRSTKEDISLINSGVDNGFFESSGYLYFG